MNEYIAKVFGSIHYPCGKIDRRADDADSTRRRCIVGNIDSGHLFKFKDIQEILIDPAVTQDL